MSCPFKVNSNTIELTVDTSFYCLQDLLCVTQTPTQAYSSLNRTFPLLFLFIFIQWSITVTFKAFYF